MVRILSGELFYTKVIYTEGKGGLAGFIVLEDWGIFHRFIPIWGEFVDELFEGKYDSFFEYIYYTADLEVYTGIRLNTEVIFLHDFLGD